MLFLLCQVPNDLVIEQKFRLYFRFCIIKLRGLFLNCIGNGGLLLQNFIDHLAGFGDIGVITLNFGCSIGHFIDGLVDDYLGVGFPHDFINLVAFSSDKQGNHSLRHKNDNRKLLLFNRFIDLIHIIEEPLGTVILLVHIIVKYLDVPAVQVRNAQIWVELYCLNLVFSDQGRKPRLNGLQFL